MISYMRQASSTCGVGKSRSRYVTDSAAVKPWLFTNSW